MKTRDDLTDKDFRRSIIICDGKLLSFTLSDETEESIEKTMKS